MGFLKRLLSSLCSHFVRTVVLGCRGEVDVAFVQQYTDTLRLLVQQRRTKLRDTVLVDTNFVGEFKFYDQLGATEMVEKVSRHQDTPIQAPDHQRRRIAKQDFVANHLLDTEDQLNMLVDPKSNYMQSQAMAAARQIDDVIITAYDATAFSGKTGSTSTSFDTTNNRIPVGSSGMTKEKLITAKQILDDFDVEEDDRFLALKPAQLSDLLNTDTATSSDFNTVKALVQGELNTWLGFQFKKTTRLTADGSSNRKCYAYHRAAMQLGIQKEPTGRIDQRIDKMYAWQTYFSMSIGAVRLEEKRIVQILCSES